MTLNSKLKQSGTTNAKKVLENEAKNEKSKMALKIKFENGINVSRAIRGGKRLEVMSAVGSLNKI